MDKRIDILKRERIHSGFFTLDRILLQHRLFSGAMSEPLVREHFDSGDAVGVLLYDPWKDALVFVEQFRTGALEEAGGAWMLEIVAGIIEEGELPEEVARRESFEEAGCLVKELLPIHGKFYPSPGGNRATFRMYCALVDSSGIGGIHGLAEEGEDILVTVIPYAEAIEMLNQGRVNSALPIIALQWLQLNKNSINY